MDLMDFSRDLDGFIWILEGFVFSGFNFRGIYFFSSLGFVGIYVVL